MGRPRDRVGDAEPSEQEDDGDQPRPRVAARDETPSRSHGSDRSYCIDLVSRRRLGGGRRGRRERLGGLVAQRIPVPVVGGRRRAFGGFWSFGHPDVFLPDRKKKKPRKGLLTELLRASSFESHPHGYL
jgi:hypothetical protein